MDSTSRDVDNRKDSLLAGHAVSLDVYTALY